MKISFALLTFLLALGNSAAFLTGPHRHSRALALRASYTDAEKEKAISDTSAWCLDQCIKRGDCAVFEDLASMSTTQVQDFCKVSRLMKPKRNKRKRKKESYKALFVCSIVCRPRTLTGVRDGRDYVERGLQRRVDVC
jgi:hypothetical protein